MTTPANDSSCIFCRIVSGELPSNLVGENERSVGFMDVSPATPGHLLVVPRAHAADLFEAPTADVTSTMLLAQELAALVKERLGADGVNLLQSNGPAAWQTVFHLHVHVIPRYADDPLVLPWSPTSGDPDRIAEVAATLRG